jgi:hypothetical protein
MQIIQLFLVGGIDYLTPDQTLREKLKCQLGLRVIMSKA